MEADFSGYATKAGLKCSDGLTIEPNAFQHQDKVQVPLVWQHGHKDPENVLGHALLENRPDGVYAYCFLNGTGKAKHARELVEHGDINSLSIWANELIKKSGRVLHGAIREVSLVLAGANPGARIDNVTLRHSDGELEDLDDEYIIQMGLELEHDDLDDNDDTTRSTEVIDPADLALAHADGDKSIADVYNSMTDEQKNVLHYMVGEALLESNGTGTVQQDALGEPDNTDSKEGTDQMSQQVVKHNVFENGGESTTGSATVISHDTMKAIFEDADQRGSLKKAVKAYAEEHLQHGVQDIDTLFPEARALDTTPEMFGRRVEWVAKLMGGVRKAPFSRIKTLSADLTVAEARAKGYMTGNLKKEEFFRVAKRVTTPTTVYKKQKLDRDDIIDITDFDAVVWLKGEMRLMLEEEIARAVLVGDGRPADSEDKIDEERIRPIAFDHEVYTTVVNVNLDDASSNVGEAWDAIVLNRSKLRGTGLPTLYTTETYVARALLQKDGVGRPLYNSLDELATQLRVKEIVAVEVLEEYDEIVAILVNPIDYVIGTDQGGAVAMFDDFDIDYNQYKYLIETRCSGALTKLKSALVVKKVAGADALVVPNAPTFDGEAVTIVDTAGVVYRRTDTDAVVTAAGSPYAVPEGESLTITATPAAGKYFSDSDADDWSFTNEA